MMVAEEVKGFVGNRYYLSIVLLLFGYCSLGVIVWLLFLGGYCLVILFGYLLVIN